MNDLPLFAKLSAQRRACDGHGEEIARLVPLALELAHRAGPSGIVVGDVRLAAEQRGLIGRGSGRQFSWLCRVLPAAGLVSTGTRRLSPIHRSRNDQCIYCLPEHAL